MFFFDFSIYLLDSLDDRFVIFCFWYFWFIFVRICCCFFRCFFLKFVDSFMMVIFLGVVMWCFLLWNWVICFKLLWVGFLRNGGGGLKFFIEIWFWKSCMVFWLGYMYFVLFVCYFFILNREMFNYRKRFKCGIYC